MTIIKNESEARGHHYQSQCHLKGFTDLGTKNSKLIALDFKNRKTLPPTIPKNFGKKRDFNRMELDGIAHNYLESGMADLEFNADKAIRNVEVTGKFEGDDRIYILNLMAHFAIRNPYQRGHWNSIINHSSKIMLSMAASNVGGTSNGILITEDFKKFVDEDKFHLEAPQNQHIEFELRMLDDMILWFMERKWLLIQAPDDLTFVSCDRPVALIWKNPARHKRSPGFRSPGTQIHFALSKKIALIGDFEGVNDVVLATKEDVALINSNILLHARFWGYTPKKDFYFLNPAGDVLYGIEKFWSEFNP
jgi:hypothetical protein